MPANCYDQPRKPVTRRDPNRTRGLALPGHGLSRGRAFGHGRSGFCAVLLLAGQLFSAGTAYSALGFGGPAALNTNAGTDSATDYNAQVTTDGEGNWVAVWESYNPDPRTDEDILVSRSTDNGLTWTVPVALNTNADTDSGDDLVPQVTTDRAGNWVAVWFSDDTLEGTVGTDFKILVSRSTDNGASWTDPVVLNSNSGTDSRRAFSPQVTTDGLGNWVAVWFSDDPGGGTLGTDADILVSRSITNGATWTDPVALNSNAATDMGEDFAPQVTTNGAGDWVAVWYAFDVLGGGEGDILYSRSTNNGVTWSARMALNTNAATDSGGDFTPQVATDCVGNWVAVWDSADSLDGTIGGDNDILYSRSTNNGATWTAPTALNTNAATDSGNDQAPQVSTDGVGNWVAVWHSFDDLGGMIGADPDILVSHSTNDGATWTAPAALNTNAATDSGFDVVPQLATDGGGNWVAVWHSDDTLEGTIGADFDILVSTSNSISLPSIQVTSPNGGETWLRRTRREITWTSDGNVGTDVSITAWRGTTPTVVTTSTLDDGSFFWNIPANITTGMDYSIEICSVSNPSVCDESDGLFSIRSLPIVTDVNALDVPEGGVANFQVKLGARPFGSVIVNVSRNSGDADITVSSGASLVFTSGNWNVFQTVGLAAAEDADMTDGVAIIRCSGSGLMFKNVTATEVDNDIVPTLTVTSPNGGEMWPRFSTQTFTWDSSGAVGADVSIKLRRIGRGIVEIVTASTPNDGSFTWTVVGVNAANNWRAEIASVSNPAILDQSNAGFAITP